MHPIMAPHHLYIFILRSKIDSQRKPELILNIFTVDGVWGSWQAWSTCSMTCGGGEQSRMRNCDDPPQSGNGTNCTGYMNATQTCNNFTCPRKYFCVIRKSVRDTRYVYTPREPSCYTHCWLKPKR